MKIRFIAKHDSKGWGVYDTVVACWPIQLPGIGVIEQNHANEALAQAEAERVQKWHDSVS